MPTEKMLAQCECTTHKGVFCQLWQGRDGYWLLAPIEHGQTLPVHLEYDARHNRLHPAQKALKHLQPEHLTALETMTREVFGEHPRENTEKARANPTPKVRVSVTKRAKDRLEISAKVGTRTVGWLITKYAQESSFRSLSKDCAAGLRETEALGAHYVSSVHLDEAYRAQGIGASMYLTAAKTLGIRGLALIASRCVEDKGSGPLSTSIMAERVWKSRGLAAQARVAKTPNAMVIYMPGPRYNPSSGQSAQASGVRVKKPALLQLRVVMILRSMLRQAGLRKPTPELISRAFGGATKALQREGLMKTDSQVLTAKGQRQETSIPRGKREWIENTYYESVEEHKVMAMPKRKTKKAPKRKTSKTSKKAPKRKSTAKKTAKRRTAKRKSTAKTAKRKTAKRGARKTAKRKTAKRRSTAKKGVKRGRKSTAKRGRKSTAKRGRKSAKR